MAVPVKKGDNVISLSAFRSAITWVVQRSQLARLAGQRFGGKRDYYKVFGWVTDLKFEDFLGKYERQDVSRRIVDAPATATWRNPPDIMSSEEFLEAWDRVVERYKVWHYMERLDKIAGLGQYSVLLLGFNDSNSLENPVNTNRDNLELLYLQPYMQPNAEIDKFVENPSDPRFGQPLTYNLKVIDPVSANKIGPAVSGMGAKTTEMKVHWTRIIHAAEGLLQDDIYGVPRLQPVFNLLDDLMKTVGGSAEMFWLAANRGLHVNVDKDMQLKEADAANISDEVEEYMHELRRIIRTRGVEVNSLGSEVADPSGSFNSTMALISGATGIPQRILLGSEAGQLASEQDRANWSERVEERQINFAGPCMLEPLVRRLQMVNILPQEEDVEYLWPGAFRLSPLEEAQTMAATARASINFSREAQYERITTVPEARVMIGLPPEPNQSGQPDPQRFNRVRSSDSKGSTHIHRPITLNEYLERLKARQS